MNSVSLVDGHIDGQRLTDEQIINEIELCHHYGTCRAEARKEFAERLKEKAYIERGFMTFSYDTIDNLLKEMDGE